MIPGYEGFYNCILDLLKDGNHHTVSDIRDYCVKKHNITPEECNQIYEGASNVNIVYSRVHWAITYLKQAGFIESPARAEYKITDLGKTEANKNVQISTKYLEDFPLFKEFRERSKGKTNSTNETTQAVSHDDSTPEERIGNAINEINNALVDKLLDKLTSVNPYIFEKIVCDLLVKMEYGKPIYTPKSGDGGIDGIIKGDRFGFDQIYIQAKRWSKDSRIGRPEIQKFAGAMVPYSKVSQKGLFITTGKFSDDARQYALENPTQKIVLIDGEELAKLMIDYNMGVFTKNDYQVKDIDSDYFGDIEQE